ncbi:hypothetical protein OSTOST_24897 [Ostertagia ostertagi]
MCLTYRRRFEELDNATQTFSKKSSKKRHLYVFSQMLGSQGLRPVISAVYARLLNKTDSLRQWRFSQKEQPHAYRLRHHCTEWNGTGLLEIASKRILW